GLSAPPRAISETYLWLLALYVERASYRWNISSKETNDRGDNSHEGNRGNGPGRGIGRDEADRAARAAGSDKRRHRSDSCIGIRPDCDGVALDLDRSP